MEQLNFSFKSTKPELQHSEIICGVVGSGNLEVFVSELTDKSRCEIEIKTSATGFKPVWEAVLTEFIHRHAVGGLKFQLNDMGATPAVVSLRLSQAVAILKDDQHA